MYSKKLKVSFPDGTPIFSKIKYANGIATITVDEMEIVKKDKPSFAVKGKIVIQTTQRGYVNTITTLENYLEGLMLKELENEDRNTSHGINIRSPRFKKSNTSRGLEKDTGEGEVASIHAGSRGDEHTERGGKRKHTPPMDESGNTELGEEDKEGN